MRHSLDRLAPALVSDDLSSAVGRRGDADFVAALGVVSRKYPMASPLVRMYLTHDREAAKEALRIAASMARKAAIRCRVPAKVAECWEIGRAALEYAVNKTCPRCHGTKFETISGSNCLSSVSCKGCGGDGRKTLPRRNRQVIAEVVGRIERLESNLDGLVADKV